MAVSKHEITEHALGLGFDDVRFASAESIKTRSALTLPLASIHASTCIIVLFTAYLPASDAPEDSINVSPYYVASNAAYHAAKALAAYIKSRGAEAVHTTLISAKEAAQRTGGFIADNGFYYHERFGSYVCIQTILTDALSPEAYNEATRRECLHCSACAAACPSKAVHNIKNCLRYHSNALIPETLRGDVYQLFGCEKCQSACPMNCEETSAAHAFRVDELLDGLHTAALKALAGPNQARAMRILSQAALYAANINANHLAPKIKALCETAGDPVRTHALWAYDKLKGDD